MHKISIAIALLAIFCLFSCTQHKEPYVLVGQIENIELDSLYVQLPVDGAFFYRVNSTKVPVDSLGFFRLEVTDETKGYALFPFPKEKTTIRTWISPGVIDSVFIDYENYDKLNFSGFHAKANTLVNSFERVPYFHAFGGKDEKYQKDSVAQRVYDQLMTRQSEEVEEINELLSNDEITEDYANAIKLESEMHWKSVFSAATWRHFYFKEKLKRTSPYDQRWQKLFIDIFETFDFNDPIKLSSNYYRTLAEDYINLYPAIKGIEQEIDSTLSQKERSNQWHANRIGRILNEFEGKNQEYMWSYYLNSAAMQRRYERELLDSYEKLKKTFPDVPYDVALIEYIEPIRAYHVKLEQPIPDEIIMIENADEFNSWEEIVEPYKGEILYVDLWATWCGPCKAEFEKKVGLYEFAKENRIRLMYISSDRDEAEELWKEMVNYYDLKGINMRISDDLNWKIWSMIHDENFASIPRYLIVDREGNMVVKDAPRPSAGDELYNLLKRYL